jgi:hypothetical protein
MTRRARRPSRSLRRQAGRQQRARGRAEANAASKPMPRNRCSCCGSRCAALHAAARPQAPKLAGCRRRTHLPPPGPGRWRGPAPGPAEARAAACPRRALCASRTSWPACAAQRPGRAARPLAASPARGCRSCGRRGARRRRVAVGRGHRRQGAPQHAAGWPRGGTAHEAGCATPGPAPSRCTPPGTFPRQRLQLLAGLSAPIDVKRLVKAGRRAALLASERGVPSGAGAAP